MKKIILFVILLLIASCKDDINSSKELLFNSENILKLSIDDLNTFWQEDSIWFSVNPTAFFENYEGFLKNSRYESETHKVIEINVFQSKQIAINAMEEFRTLISAITLEGDPKNYFGERWWYIQGSSFRSIWVNKYNTIIFVSNSSSEDDNITINTATEILGRIESLSE